MSAHGLRRCLLRVLLLGLQLLLSRPRGIAGCLRLPLRLLRYGFLLLCLLLCSRRLAQVQKLLSSSQIPVTARAHIGICTRSAITCPTCVRMRFSCKIPRLEQACDVVRASDCASSAVFFSLAACCWAACTAAYSLSASFLAALAWRMQRDAAHESQTGHGNGRWPRMTINRC